MKVREVKCPKCGHEFMWMETVASLETIDRIRFIRDICDEEDVETLIAGAFGCGVFAQKPEMVAHYFREYFSDTKVKAVIFAVPPDRNYVAFEREFK
ncbi:TIGR02452 family protein [Pseudobutyrivibrio sp. ACV-2]|uniref:hypothetical protein n=1 Tax=Pseudobutyrivibrio sp. ACV-2 TaxID=1520801 RepID=UPI0008986514|nr:hypothetical protein [Pseudobutyrivibrio sp. ACV-2]SEA70003.1 TIGR02452 family protein [Pseudobutyrivibrio sp. ACV-2]